MGRLNFLVSHSCQNSLLGEADGLSTAQCPLLSDEGVGLYLWLSTLAAQEKSLGDIFFKYQHGASLHVG